MARRHKGKFAVMQALGQAPAVFGGAAPTEVKVSGDAGPGTVDKLIDQNINAYWANGFSSTAMDVLGFYLQWTMMDRQFSLQTKALDIQDRIATHKMGLDNQLATKQSALASEKLKTDKELAQIEKQRQVEIAQIQADAKVKIAEKKATAAAFFPEYKFGAPHLPIAI